MLARGMKCSSLSLLLINKTCCVTTYIKYVCMWNVVHEIAESYRSIRRLLGLFVWEYRVSRQSCVSVITFVLLICTCCHKLHSQMSPAACYYLKWRSGSVCLYRWQLHLVGKCQHRSQWHGQDFESGGERHAYSRNKAEITEIST